jgi:hypothetical protein
LQHGKARQIYHGNGGLHVFRQNKNVFWAFKAKSGDIHPKKIIGLCKQLSHFWIILVEFQAHANILGTLAGKEEDPRLHCASP